jgi:cytochrome d ubiquinol oxidase subunit I
VAVEAGWIVREVGRQPWVVYGLLRTKDAVSTVSASSVTLSMAMFFAFYVVLLLTFFVLARNWLRAGPDLSVNPQSAVHAERNAAVTEY